jgi:hypothetical protein
MGQNISYGTGFRRGRGWDASGAKLGVYSNATRGSAVYYQKLQNLVHVQDVYGALLEMVKVSYRCDTNDFLIALQPNIHYSSGLISSSSRAPGVLTLFTP